MTLRLHQIAVALALSNAVSGFAPLAKKGELPRKSRAQKKILTDKVTRNDSTGTTSSISMAWPGKDDAKEAEGKREIDSKLKLSGEASEASLFFEAFSSTESLEEFVAPATNKLDDITGGWALSYANLEPEDETTPIGISFLATNIAYGLAGLLVVQGGDPLLGVAIELACVFSFAYHFAQLKFGQEGSRIVRLSLLVDYIFAFIAIVAGSSQLLLSGQLPTEALYAGSAALSCLFICWIKEEGLFYIFWHSLWHLLSAYTGYVIGTCVSQ